jgi:hypothetical protein
VGPQTAASGSFPAEPRPLEAARRCRSAIASACTAALSRDGAGMYCGWAAVGGGADFPPEKIPPISPPP